MELRSNSAYSGCQRAIAGLAMLACAVGTTAPALAEDIYFVPDSRVRAIPNKFEDAFFTDTKDFYTNRSIFQQTQNLFGLINQPENKISRDAGRVHNLYRRVLSQQLTNSPVLRTPDLPTPFYQSILTMPRTDLAQQLPVELPQPYPYPVPVTPAPLPPAPPAPVRALW